MRYLKKLFSTLLLLSLCFCALAQKSEQSGWYVKGYTEETAKSYFDRRYSLDLIEGIWQSNDGFKYAIERDVEDDGSRSTDKYRVIILESSHNGWSLGQIKGFVSFSSINGVYSLKYYTRNSNGENLESQNVILVVESPIIVSFNRMDGAKINMIKLYPKVEGTEAGSVSGSEKMWSGSSIVIGDRYLATNNHVVDGARSLVISGLNDNYNKDYSVEVVAVDKNVDLAIIKVTDPDFEGFGFPTYGISTTTADVGTDIFVLGYPITTVMGQEIKLTTGVISSKTGYQGDPATYQISAAVQPGNSGGPMFDGEGNLIGIVVSKITQAENVGYAIKLSNLRNLVESCSDRISFDYTNRISQLPLTEKIKKISPFVYYVKANAVSNGIVSNSSGNGDIGSIPKDPDVARDYLRAANQMVEDKRYDEAFDLVKKSVAAYPGKENHYLRAALAVDKFEVYDMAIESAQYCLEQKYNLPQCYQILARAYYAQEKWEESIGMWNKVLDDDRKNVSAYYYRAHAFKEKGDIESALKDFNAGLKFEGVSDVNFAYFYNDLAYIYMDKGDLQTAERYLNKTLELGHSNGNFLDSYGELMYKKGNYDECRRYMGAAITQGKKNEAPWLENSYYYRGLANKKLGFDADAYEDLSRAVELKNEDAKKALNEMYETDNQKSGKFFNLYRTPSIRTAPSHAVSKLTAIETTEESTTLYFSASAIDGWVNTSFDVYILEDATPTQAWGHSTKKESNNRLYLVTADGIAFSPERTEIKNKRITFTLTFPPIAEDCQEIDLIGTGGYELKGIALKDNYSADYDPDAITWEEVAVTDNPKYAEGLIAVESITESSGWGGAASKKGFENCVKALQKKAAKKGCCLVVITNVSGGYGVGVTATIYKRP